VIDYTILKKNMDITEEFKDKNILITGTGRGKY